MQELMQLADELGIQVRAESLGGEGGGLCTLRGVKVLFIDTDADPTDRLERTARALASANRLDAVYVRPEVRDLLDTYGT